jgi:hypothetical protein
LETFRSISVSQAGMNRTALYAVIAVLAVAVIGLGIYLYNEQQKPGLSITVDESGIDIEGRG